ncbi:MAG TPA: response regulator transcription factor [Chloroflexia bacterium]|nr:response regulator transcription factor [Chloroflexia bacterium]
MPPLAAMQILIVDDEPAIARALRPGLQGHGFTVFTSATGEEALAHLAESSPDLILLDLGLPDVDGLDLIGALRERTAAPIIVLSVRGTERDKIAALDNGADDYLTKPFSMGELLARLRVALRHGAHLPPVAALPQPITIGDVTLDPDHHTVAVMGSRVHLSPTEFQLLETFMSHAGKLLSHRTLLHKVWGPEYAVDTQLLRVYIGQLRAKIEPRPERPSYILTEPGIGYRFRDADEGDAAPI